MTAREIIAYMESLRNDEQRQVLMRFFKTGPGEYGEGDEFLGLKVPQTREVVKLVAKDFPIDEVPELLMSRWHEVRLCGLLILVDKFEKQATIRLENNPDAIHRRDEIVTMYLLYSERANNWDLVDLSAPKILGHWLLLPTDASIFSTLQERKDATLFSPLQERKDATLLSPPKERKDATLFSPPKERKDATLISPPKEERDIGYHFDYKRDLLDSLATSTCLWRQRISMVCTWKTSQQGDPSWCLHYAEMHLHHPHDLMHKAVGWMLREMGKRVSMDLLRDFLNQHAHEMSRTTLRYAIEKMPYDERQFFVASRSNKG